MKVEEGNAKAYREMMEQVSEKLNHIHDDGKRRKHEFLAKLARDQAALIRDGHLAKAALQEMDDFELQRALLQKEEFESKKREYTKLFQRRILSIGKRQALAKDR